LVDEFQDINQIQWKLINLLVGEQQKLFLVGDPNQSIYGFQGSSPTLISSLQNERKWTKIFLNINYRSTNNILQVGNNFLANNSKMMVSNFLQTTKESGTAARIIRSFSISTVVRQILYFIRNEAIKLSEIAIIYRSNYLSTWLEQELVDQKIPYEILGSFKFIEREEIKDTLAYLRTILFQDDLSLLRVLKLVSGVGAKTIEAINEANYNAKQTIFTYLQVKWAELKKTDQSNKKGNLFVFLHSLNIYQKKSYQSGKLGTFIKEILHSIQFL
jgi:DNA helicase-2/ATP-dependent DNA helicase PcrA